MPRKLDLSDEELLDKLIHRHVLKHEAVSEVAKTLRISRSKAHGLLRRAQNDGTLQIIVNREQDPQSSLGRAVLDYYEERGVREVIVVPGPPDDSTVDSPEYRTMLRATMGAQAAHYLDRRLSKGDHLAVGDGRTILNFAQRFQPSERRLVVRPLVVGGRWRPIEYADASTVVQILHYRLGYPLGEGVSAFCPEIAPGMAESMRGRVEIEALFGPNAVRPRATISSLRARRYRRTQDPSSAQLGSSTLVTMVAHARFYTAPEYSGDLEKLKLDPHGMYKPLKPEVYSDAYRTLLERSVITDINRVGVKSLEHQGENPFDTLGLENCWRGVDPKLLHSWRQEGTNNVLVVAGSKLGPALRAVLAVECFETLILDTALALQVLPVEKRPQEYRRIPVVSGDDSDAPIPPARIEARAATAAAPINRRRKPQARVRGVSRRHGP